MRKFGRRIYYYPCLDSTNLTARFLAHQGEKEGTVVIAGEQTNGQGRGGNRWFSPPGGLWFSLILYPNIPISSLGRINMAAAGAVAFSIQKLFPSLSTNILWPNDVLIEGKKVGGVMCRASLDGKELKFVILGLGINVNMVDFPSPLGFTATSLSKEIGRKIYLSFFLAHLLKELEQMYRLCLFDFSSLLEMIHPFLYLLGKLVTVGIDQDEISGLVQGLDEEGCLILRLESGVQRKIDLGERSIHLRKIGEKDSPIESGC